MGPHLAALNRYRPDLTLGVCYILHDLTLVATGRKFQSSRFRHGSSMGRISLKFGHTTPRPSLRPPGQSNPCETCLWVAADILLGMRVPPKPLRAWKEDLSPLRLEKLGPHRLGIVGVGPPARVVWLAFASINSTYAESSGNATCEPRLDLGHGHRRLVGVSVNCHT